MLTLTDKQKAFVQAKAAGMGHGEAARHAGYSAGGAHVQGTNLMKRADIRKAIAAAKQETRGDEPTRKRKSSIGAEITEKRFGSSLKMMQAIYDDTELPLSMRFEAAKQALPYEHAKIGEKGKKEQKNDDAKDVANGSKFRTKKPPLRLVGKDG